MTTTKTLFWVKGDTKKGFEIVTKMPKTKIVREPFETLREAQIFIANEWSMSVFN
jgi:hypothetical protein